MTTVPSNLIPTRITQLPEYQGASTAGFLPYVIDGVTYKVQFSNIAAVGAVPSSRTITGGSGLTGGGDLSADRVISIAAGGVGFGQLADSGVAAGTYGDSSNIPVLTVDEKGRVTIAATTPIDLGAYVPITRSITAGDGLTGGGTLAANRTISLILSTALPQSGGTPGAGTATVAAREDHVHPAVDLTDTTETSGVLPMSRGGTGSSLSPVAGAILYSDGSNVDLSNPGVANQLLFSEGTAAPTWRSLTGGSTGLTFGLSGSNYVLGGTLALASGGTGATTVTAARVNLLPSYAGNAGRVLAVNALATDVEWIVVSGGGGGGSGTVTSVDVSGGTTGLTTSGGPVTTSGVITLAGTLAVANGGTGATDAATARSNLGAASAGAIISSGLTMSTARLLGRTTASTGAVQEITVGSGLTLTGGTLAATGGGVGTVTSVNVSGGTTGVTFTGGPITSSGTITMSGTLSPANGGTGVTSYTSGQLLIGRADGGLSESTLTAGTGVSITNGDGSITIANSAPDRTVVLTGGTGISTSGTYPNFTVTNTAPDQTVVLTAGTGISTSGTYPNFTITNAAPNQVVSLTGAGTTSVTGTYPNFTITSNDQFAGTVTSVSGAGTVNGLTLTGTVTTSGSLTLGGTLSVDLSTATVTGTLPVARGGTGVTTSTGTGSVVLSNSPTLVTPVLGAASATSIANGLGAVSTPSYTFTGDTNTGMWSPAADAIAFSTNSLERMRVTAAGDVGIGTSSPGATLDVAGTFTSGFMTVKGDGTEGGQIVFNNSSNTGAPLTLDVDDSGNGRLFTTANNANLTLGQLVGTGGIVLFHTSSAERMRITSAGDVGIGTSAPGNRLDIVGAGSSQIRVRDGVGATSLYDFGRDGTDGFFGFSGAQTTFSGYKWSVNAGTEVMRITNAGNVGIGTSSPGYKLSVSGTAEITAAKEGVFTVTDGTTVNLDPNNGSIQTWTLGANRTPGQANWATGQSITLMVDDGTARTITWSTLAVVWETNGGNAPTLALTGFTVIVLWKVGTTIYGARVGDA